MHVQARRLALGCCLHDRLGSDAQIVVDMDVVRRIGQRVVAQSLTSRADAAQQLAAAQRARMLRGEAILPGTVVRFDAHGDGVYVGDSHAGGRASAARTRTASRRSLPRCCGSRPTASSRPCARRPRTGPAQEGYAFRFGADATVELMHLALMEPTEWRVLPGSELAPRAAIAKGVPPTAIIALPSPAATAK